MTAYTDFDVRSFLDLQWVDRFAAYLPQAHEWWNNPLNETTDYGVDPTTIRAMGTGSKEGDPTWGPLAAFNAWAKHQVAELDLSSPATAAHASAKWKRFDIETFDDFETWHRNLAESLDGHWRDWLEKTRAASLHPDTGWQERARACNADGSLCVAHKYKLVDLFVRFLRLLAPAGTSFGAALVRHAHIPLDMKSIAVISATVGNLSVGGGTSMGDIKTELAYQTYQRLARVICDVVAARSDNRSVAVSPIIFDVFAWHNRDAQALYTDFAKEEKKRAAKEQGANEGSKRRRAPRKSKPKWWQTTAPVL
ncbi:hypothetical protein F6X40_10600 [Paraburkholderia sp. UCT31]|uniref:hypothetical protein n=1 Tax=Paraburkholderia sp. UCT31 TaxID=2615209 RepID=UPI001655BE9C|nr:hypothetical protein [Paraburkholderia sp. UCT31]MBC8737257.1 hypothetical protein [Paraburkholderia sp. UCT31]